jgi:hypothetical protein
LGWIVRIVSTVGTKRKRILRAVLGVPRVSDLRVKENELMISQSNAHRGLSQTTSSPHGHHDNDLSSPDTGFSWHINPVKQKGVVATFIVSPRQAMDDSCATCKEKKTLSSAI